MLTRVCVLCLCILVSWSFAVDARSKPHFKSEPTFDEIMPVILQAEHLSWSDGRQWKKQMRRAPWLPTLSVGYDHSFRETESIAITDNISVTSSAVNVGPSDNNWDESLNRAQVFRVRALWSLDQLIFHSATFQRSSEMRNLSHSRQNLVDDVFKTYQERKKLVRLIDQGCSSKCRLMRAQVESFTEKINFYTRGAFAHRWRRFES